MNLRCLVFHVLLLEYSVLIYTIKSVTHKPYKSLTLQCRVLSSDIKVVLDKSAFRQKDRAKALSLAFVHLRSLCVSPIFLQPLHMATDFCNCFKVLDLVVYIYFLQINLKNICRVLNFELNKSLNKQHILCQLKLHEFALENYNQVDE